MLTHAARRFSITRSAMRSAAARSGRLVSTSSVRMFQPFMDGREAQADAELALEFAIVKPPRFAHEIAGVGERGTRHPRRSRQARGVGYEVQPVAQLHARVVAGVID